MSYRRTNVRQFSLANDAYINAVITFYAVDTDDNTITDNLVILYDAPTGDGMYSNPITLDGRGKFQFPVYIDTPCIGVVSGSLVGNHTTGIIYPLAGEFKGEWEAGTEYIIGDIVEDGANGTNTGNLYIAPVSHTSGIWVNDLAAVKWELFFDVTAIREFRDQAEAAAAAAEGFRDEAEGFANNAAQSATDASGYADEAEASAALVLTALRPTTSLTSMTVNTSQKTMTIEAPRQYQAGDWLKVSVIGDPTTYQWGPIDSYDGDVTVIFTPITTGGSGTYASWNVNVSGERGPIGPSGSGTGDMLSANNLSDVASIPAAVSNLGLTIGVATQAYNQNIKPAVDLFLSTNLV